MKKLTVKGIGRFVPVVLLALLIASVGGGAIVFGNTLMSQSESGKATLEASIAPITLATLDSTMAQINDGIASMTKTLNNSTDPGTIKMLQGQIATMQGQQMGMSMVKTNQGLLDLVQGMGFILLLIGAGFVIVAVGVFGLGLKVVGLAGRTPKA